MDAAKKSRRSRKKIFIWATVVFLLLAVANAAFYLKRDKRDTYYPATYKTLYVPSDVPVLAGTRVVERGHVELKIQMLDKHNNWRITDDTGETYTNEGPFPIVKLKDFKHSYEIEPLDGSALEKKISVQFGFYSSEYYKKGGRTQPDNYWMVSSAIPVGKFRQYPLAYWTDTYDYIDPADREEARRMLKEEVGIADSDPTTAKIEKIGCWLITKWQGCAGTPSDRVEKEKSPLRILKMVLKAEGKIWCSQHALIYHFFANMAGMPTRLISLAGRVDNVITTGHAFAETFIPEQGEWAKVDTSLNKLLMLNHQGRALSSAEVYHAIISGNISGLTARACKEGSIVSVPYAEVSDSDSYYYTPGSHLVFRPGKSKTQGKLSKYLFRPDLAYSLDLSALEKTYFLRRALFLAGLAAGIAWMVSLAGFFTGKPRQKG